MSWKVTGPDTNLLTHPHSQDHNVPGATLLTHVGEFLPGGWNFVQAANLRELKGQEVSRCLELNRVVIPNHKCLTPLPPQITFKIDIYFQTKPVAL